MPIVVACQCGRKFQTKDEYAGRQAKCPGCGMMLTIPSPEAEFQEVEQEERYVAEAPREEAPVNAAGEGRRIRQLKAEKQAQIQKRNYLIAAGSVVVMVGIAVGVMLSRRESTIPTHLPETDLKPTAALDGKPAPPQPPPSLPDPSKPLPPPPTGQMDEIERFIQWAMLTRDSSLKANAMVFKPGDTRLQFNANWRKPTAEQAASFKTKTGALASILDLEYGPPPSPAMDQVEARMLMDPDLVGTCVCTATTGKKSIIYVFLEPCKATIADVVKKYGPPAADPLPSGNGKIHFYGRMALVEVEAGQVHFVARKDPRG